MLDEQNFAIRQLVRALQDLVSVVPGAQSVDDSLRIARVGKNINRVCTTNKFVVVCCSSIKKALNETKKYILSRDLRTLRVTRELDTGEREVFPEYVYRCLQPGWIPDTACIEKWLQICTPDPKQYCRVWCAERTTVDGVRLSAPDRIEVHSVLADRLVIPTTFGGWWALVWHEEHDSGRIKIIPLYKKGNSSVLTDRGLEATARDHVERELQRRGINCDLSQAEVKWGGSLTTTLMHPGVLMMVIVNQVLTTEWNRPEHCYNIRDRIKDEFCAQRVLENMQCCLAAGACVVNLMGDLSQPTHE